MANEGPVLVKLIVWRDIMYALEWGGRLHDVDSGSLWMNWRLYPISELEIGASDDESTWAPKYERTGAVSSMDVTPLINESTPAFEGFIKWDGCMQFRASDGFNFHVDERQDIRQLAEALERIRDVARETFDNGEIPGR